MNTAKDDTRVPSPQSSRALPRGVMDLVRELEAERARKHESGSSSPLPDQFYEIGPTLRLSPSQTITRVRPVRGGALGGDRV